MKHADTIRYGGFINSQAWLAHVIVDTKVQAFYETACILIAKKGAIIR